VMAFILTEENMRKDFAQQIDHNKPYLEDEKRCGVFVGAWWAIRAMLVICGLYQVGCWFARAL
jgi:hypothetical protein